MCTIIISVVKTYCCVSTFFSSWSVGVMCGLKTPAIRPTTVYIFIVIAIAIFVIVIIIQLLLLLLLLHCYCILYCYCYCHVPCSKTFVPL